jgi:hypothetical protein
VVRQFLPGATAEWAELVSFDLPVQTESSSLADVRKLFR